MTGCAGSVAWTARNPVCGTGYTSCTAQQYMNNRGAGVPQHNYWTDSNLKYDTNILDTDGNCSVGVTGSHTNTCSGGPMLVCKSTQPDAEGNNCTWKNCGYDTNTPNEYFGGCPSTSSAGTLCCPKSACADGSNEQIFGPGMIGCGGAVTFANKGSLCAAGWSPCTAKQYVARRAGYIPNRNYWTSDDLHYDGSGSSACSASKTSGYSCGTTPMRVCTTTQPDAHGNSCNWINCGLDGQSPNEYFGGCSGNTNAGTLCCQ
jgi:hypothetical protein